MAADLSAVAFGLASAVAWGTGDFSGGLASRRTRAQVVLLMSQALGLAATAALALLLSEPFPTLPGLLYGAAAGLAGVGGLVALYRGLAAGPMAIVAPVAALVSAAVPLAWGLWLEGLPGVPQLAGFALALVAVWLVSRTGGDARFRLRSLFLPVTAGLWFGLFLILIDAAVDVAPMAAAVLWPLVAARLASIALLAVLVARLPRPHRPRAAPPTARPTAVLLLLALLAGLLDAAGNAFYALAARTGRLDSAAVLSSLYPATTVLLARLVLRERATAWQWAGVGAALAAVALIAS